MAKYFTNFQLYIMKHGNHHFFFFLKRDFIEIKNTQKKKNLRSITDHLSGP